MNTKSNLEQEINGHIRTLSRGLMQSDYAGAYRGYNALYRIGMPVIPSVKELIFKSDWSNNKFKELTLYLTGLVCLIYDIDEREGNQIISHIISSDCPQHIKSLLRSLSQFSQADYKRYKVKGIDVLEHKELSAKYDIKPYIESWLEYVPKEDIRDIVRIIIVRPDDMDASGSYALLLCKITLAWGDTFKPNTILFRLLLFSIEYTFYHEIGHHVFRHTFGHDPIQEKEADSYAGIIMDKAHPRIGYLVKLLRAIGL